jgi:hypothetical protein
MSLTNCPACDENTFDIESQTCGHCSYGKSLEAHELQAWLLLEAARHPETGKEAEMAEHDEQNEKETKKDKVYPGQLDDFLALREARQAAQATDNVDASHVIGLAVAEQLAGLNYILDGIRYSTRNRSSS